mgnify:FL=1
MTYTYALMQLSKAAYDEIAAKMKEAGYEHAFDGQVISMQGIGVEPTSGPELGGGQFGDVDPWRLQTLLMDISGQQRPQTLRIGTGAILYLALKLEELGETIEALASVLSAHGSYATTAEEAKQLPDLFARVMDDLSQDYAAEPVHLTMQRVSRAIRGSLKLTGLLADTIPLTLEQARPIADGTTDEAVVNAGFAASLGLPGSILYSHVNRSNLSKANPVTGMIDKDPSGKWIKGPGYKEPEIDEVLRPLIDRN